MKLKLLKIAKLLLLVTSTGLVAALLWTGYHYVHTAPRFSVKQVRFMGLKRVDEDDVLARVNLKNDGSTNILAVDLEGIRASVEQIQWVRYAMVQRVLPDQIIIKVVEREPIGLARIQGNIYEFDIDAAILVPDKSTTPDLPILDGLRANDQEGNLRKVGMYTKLLGDIGSDHLAQVIVNDTNEVSVVRSDDSLLVNLGVDDFKDRWSRYLSFKSKINTDYKNAVRVDLRFRNQIVVSQSDDDSGKVIWDGKKKSL